VARPIREAAVEKRFEESVSRVVSAHILAHAPGSALLTTPYLPSLRPA
jgi:hypothetical protein